MKAKIVCLVMGLFLLAAVTAQAADANDRFKGGSYDGWCRDATSEYAALIFRSTIIRLSMEGRAPSCPRLLSQWGVAIFP